MPQLSDALVRLSRTSATCHTEDACRGEENPNAILFCPAPVMLLPTFELCERSGLISARTPARTVCLETPPLRMLAGAGVLPQHPAAQMCGDEPEEAGAHAPTADIVRAPAFSSI